MSDINDYTLYALIGSDPDQRNVDGTGNSTIFRNGVAAGSVLHTEVRVTSASYTSPNGEDDGEEILGDDDTSDDDSADPTPGTKPSPRAVSDGIMSQADNESFPNAALENEFGSFFGQFITHDVTEARGDGNESLDLVGDAFGFTRTPDDDGNPNNQREQQTDVTSFLNLDLIYGRSEIKALLARGDDGKLIMGADGVLPNAQDIVDNAPANILSLFNGDADRNNDGVFDAADVSGIPFGPGAFDGIFPLLAPGEDVAPADQRSNQTAQISTQHTIWMLNHNYHAEQLAAAGVTDEDQIYNAARAITEAEWQWVIYNEYLPKVIGERNVREYSGYDPNTDPSVINEWAQVAFRFGHDQSNNTQVKMAESGFVTQTVTLASAFGNASDITLNGDPSEALAQWIRGELSAQTQEIDGRVVNGSRNFLFGGGPGGGVEPFDLEVLDIARGRDHGVGNYNVLYSELTGRNPYNSFQEFAAANNLSQDRLNDLIATYGANGIDQMDSIIGVLLEDEVRDSQLGITGTTLIAMQFERLREGDKYYFENRMDAEQIAGIKQTTMADILARTTDIDYVYHDAFSAHSRLSVAAGTVGQASNNRDLIMGSRNSETLNGLGNSDDIYGEGGNDRINGGQGQDYAWGGFGNDTINGNNNGDFLWGDQGNDRINGGNGNDEIHGGEGVDQLFGNNGDDIIFGDNGNDRIDGGAHNDTITGGEGNDLITYSGGHDVITDLHNNGGERVIFTAAFGGRSVIQQNQWNSFLSQQNASVSDADGDGSADDVVISFNGANSLTLLDFADDIVLA